MYIHAKVQAGAKEEKIFRKSEDHFEISVREKAERNMANKKVISLVAENFGVPAGKVRMISGHRSPSKILDVEV